MKEKIERNIDKDIEILKENYPATVVRKNIEKDTVGDINKIFTSASVYQLAVENVLSELETYKKIAYKLAEELAGNDDYMQNIIDWTRKEVEKEC